MMVICSLEKRLPGAVMTVVVVVVVVVVLAEKHLKYL